MRKLIKLLVITFMLTALPGLALANNTNLKDPVEFQSAHFILNKNYYFKNDQRQNMDASVFAQSGRTYVPFRYLAYALGVPEENVTWDATTNEVTLTKDNITEKFTVGSTTYYINSQAKTIDAAPLAKDGRTYLPARFVAEAFGYTTGYDTANNVVTISKGGSAALPPTINADPTNPPYDLPDVSAIKAETARKLFGEQLVLPEDLVANGNKLALIKGTRDVIVNPETTPLNETNEVIAGTGTYLKNYLPAPLARRDSTYKDRNGNIETSNPEFYPLKEMMLISGFPEQNIFWNPDTKTMAIYGSVLGDEYYDVIKVTAGKEYQPGTLVAAPLLENGSLLVTNGDYNKIVRKAFPSGHAPVHNGVGGYTADPHVFIKWME